MEKRLLTLAAATVLMTGYVQAEDMKAEDMKADSVKAEAVMPDAMVSETAGAMAEMDEAMAEETAAVNTVCPISGEMLDPATAEKIEFEGKWYNVSKKGKEAFDAAPDQFAEKFAALDEQMAEAGDEVGEAVDVGKTMMDDAAAKASDAAKNY